ncbi:thioredoxin [Chloroflexota bacterium]
MAKPMVVDEKSFDKILQESSLPMLVDFWAPWCPPCKAIAPIVEELAEEYSGKLNFAKLNVDDAPLIAPRYGVHSVPTLLIFKEGEPADQVVGLKTKEELKQVLEKVLS